ncbi:MAG: hypothetical protein HQK51_00780 [Oligoflexia bacterium]|nr:hypothetical protein [Oligoflexia bacterium]
MKKINIEVVLAFLVFSYVIVLSNFFDWDMFYSFFEVDRRSWLYNFEVPIWSYQLCSGVTRIGDAQAFGVSPLFIFPLLFGSVIGSKILIIASAIYGFYFIKKFIELIYKTYFPIYSVSALAGPPAAETALLVKRWFNLIALSFIFSNFFLWHFIFGHVSFLLFYLALVYFYVTTKSLIGKLEKEDFFHGLLSLILIFTSGFYHVTIFFLLPLFITYLLTVISLIIINCKQVKYSLLSNGVIVFLALLVSSYKWVPSIIYQLNHSRILTEKMLDVSSIKEFLIDQFLPTINFKYLGIFNYIPVNNSANPFGIWEKSVFSINAFLTLVALALFLFNFKKIKKFILGIHRKNNSAITLLIFFIFIFITYVSLSLGNFAEWAPYNLLNKYIVQGSLRVASRFGFGVSLLMIIPTIFLFHFCIERKFKKIYFLIYILLLLNILENNSTRSFRYFKWFLFVKSNEANLPMNQQTFIHSRSLIPDEIATSTTSFSYPYLLQGKGVVACENSSARENILEQETKKYTVENLRTELIETNYKKLDFRLKSYHSFIYEHDKKGNSIDNLCKNLSYYTQNKIMIDKSCPIDVCLNVNSLSVNDKNKFKYNEKYNRYCRFSL